MRRYVDRKEVQRQRQDWTVRLNFYGTIYGPFRFVQAMRSVYGFKPDWVAYEPLEWPKVAIDGLRKPVAGAVPVKWARNEGSCLIGFGPILALHEDLEVSRGRVRTFPFTMEGGRIILDLQRWQVTPSEPSKQRAAMRARWAKLSREERARILAKAREKARKRFLAAFPKGMIKKE